MIQRIVLLVLLSCVASSALAEEPREGWFIALERCEAFQSKNKRTNPGNMYVSARVAYELKGINKAEGEWYHIMVPGAPLTEDRWVSSTCGVHVIAAENSAASNGAAAAEFAPQAGEEATDLLLTLSWQPAFCEEKPSKTECKQLNGGSLPVAEKQLSLHGLWPQPNGNFYCGVPDSIKKLDKSGDWEKLPAPELDADTAARLAKAMPGVASFLDRHEWIKHGTCFYGDRNGDEYFDDTLLVLDAINHSTVGALFEGHVGAEIDTSDIRNAFDAAFGTGAGDRVKVICTKDQGRVLIKELWINLKGEITEHADVGALIRAGDTQDIDCRGGVVDPAGLQ